MIRCALVLVFAAGIFPSHAMGIGASEGLSVKRIFRTPRYTRGNTNIMRVQPIDDAAWIWLKGDSGMSQIGECAPEDLPGGGISVQPTFLKFRNEFDVKEGDGSLVIDVSADRALLPHL